MGQQQQQQNVSKGVVIPPEPNVDFEFHVKIFIKGGKCVLHTSKGSTEEEKRKMKKDKSFTGKKWYFVTEIVLTYCEKIVMVIKKKIWNSRLKAENLQEFWDH